MSRVKFVAGALAAVLSIAAFSSAAEAWQRRCGYDPYGYHPPNFRGCYGGGYYRSGWGFYPAYGFYPAGSYYALPRDPVYAVPVPYPVYSRAFCYYDNGWDFRVRRVCVRGW